MVDNSSQNSFARFVVPVLLAITGVGLMYIEQTHLMEVIGFGLYTAGAFSFATIYNHARNPMASDNTAVRLTQALVVYGGIVIALVYESIIPTATAFVAVSLAVGLLVFGSVALEITNLNFGSSSS